MTHTINDIKLTMNHAMGIDIWDEMHDMNTSREFMEECDLKWMGTFDDAMRHIMCDNDSSLNWIGYGDEIFVIVYQNHRVIATGYMSTRGTLYQASFCTKNATYFRSNLRNRSKYDDVNWVKMNNGIMTTIAHDMYVDAMNWWKR